MTLLHDLLDRKVQRLEMRPAVRFKGASISYSDLHERSKRIAGGLSARGVSRGDRVVIYLNNQPAVVELAMACSRIGAIFVPVSAALKVRQLQHILKDSGARMLVGSIVRNEWPTAQDFAGHIVVCDMPALERFEWPGEYSRYEELAEGPPLEVAPPQIDQDAAAILYTSGSTGAAKGVVVSHRNLVSGAESVARYLENTGSDRILAALPLSFDYGLSQVTTAFAVGACAVLTNFTLAGAMVQEIVAEQVTGLAGVPTMWAHLANCEWPHAATRSLRYITNSGGAFSPALIRRLRSSLPNTSIFCMYGLTEAFRSTYLPPEELERRMGSIGKAIPNQEVFVLRADGSPCAPGEVGELVHRGSLVSMGYWNDPDLTAARFKPLQILDGKVRSELAVWSGDQVRMDDDGFLYFVGRKDGLIKTSGYRVSPNEIEEVIYEMAQIVECCAVGLLDPILGQAIAVAVVARPGADASSLLEHIQMRCRALLPTYMIPATVRLVDAIPRNPNGKHDRAAIARLFELDADVSGAERSTLPRQGS